MKLIIAIITYTACALPLCAQPNTTTNPPCKEPWCVDAAFNYQFCDTRTGARVDKCSNDPNNEPFLKVSKRAMPLTLCADFSNNLYDHVNFQSNSDPVNQQNVAVYRNSSMVARLNEAAARWANSAMCPAEGPNREYDACCLRVAWSTQDAEMGGFLEGGAANTRIHKFSSGGSKCVVDCSNSYIVVNQQIGHTQLDERGRPKFFISTEPTPWAVIPADQGYQYVYAYSMFLHELGHWLGFNHSDTPGSDGVACNHSSIMDVSGYPTSWILEQRDLTAEDACMFMKLYCCQNSKSTAGVNEAFASSLTFDIIPNPAQSSITLRLPADIRTNATLTLRIVDMAGTTIDEKRFRKSTGNISVDLSGIPNGTYMVTLSSGRLVHGKRIIVQR